jgi:hypothetical protein
MKSSKLFMEDSVTNPAFFQFARQYQEMAADRKIIRLNGLDIPAEIIDTPITRYTQGLQLYPIAFLDGVTCALREVEQVVEEVSGHFASPFALAALSIVSRAIATMAGEYSTEDK